MIRIKSVDAQNILAVCELTSNQSCAVAAANGRPRCNALSIAEAKYNPEMHPNAIYNNNVLIGFFMYERPEDESETATLRRFMLGSRFRHDGLEEKALEHVLRGLKIQGVKKVIMPPDYIDENAKKLYISFGFRADGDPDKNECRYALEL